jgi:hypothetical protein
MMQSGGGLETAHDIDSFANYIRKFVCKYYFELKPVFGDRPNIQPWYTNEGQGVDPDGDSDAFDNRDDESLFSDTEYHNTNDDSVRDGNTNLNRSVVIDVDTGEVVNERNITQASTTQDSSRINLSILDDSDDELVSKEEEVSKKKTQTYHRLPMIMNHLLLIGITQQAQYLWGQRHLQTD